ncbi:uncharacterized protein LOC111922541, partial [Cyanistes caeruleus]|uniref:uncharacterized protein LOC111922541 n=1 Tax=Cyanistes caeruleus TaxID=156563 RepID=UPI000CDAE0E2
MSEHSENSSIKDKAAFIALLAKHNAKPSPAGEEWAQNNWFNLENVTDRICSLQHEAKFKFGRNKTIICSVLGACLTSAVEARTRRRQEENAIIESLQNLVESLQNENNLLRTALSEECAKNSQCADSFKESLEKETPQINHKYSQAELHLVKNCGENCCSQMRPLIKTEYNYINDEDLDPHVTTKEIPYTATELAKLKKEYEHLPHESETEYVFRVSLTGGDQIRLSEQEASGYWGHGVFLTTGDNRNPWSLTQQAAYWAGGLNPLERGDPVALTSSPDQILENIYKASYLQLIHERKLIAGYESPMLLPVKAEIMTPLICGLPESLKPTAILLQTTIDDILVGGDEKEVIKNKDAEKRYTTWEKGLLVVNPALIEVEKITQQQPIALKGPFEITKTTTTGTLHPDGVAQRASVRKWYAQIEHDSNIFSITEEAVKNQVIQKTESLSSSHDKPDLIIKETSLNIKTEK